MNSQQLKLKYNIVQVSELGLNYWAIPKVGNTSIKAAILKAGGVSYDNEQGVHHHSKLTYISPVTAMSNGLRNLSVVRDPYDRFVSMFADTVRRPRTFGFRDSPSLADLQRHIESRPDNKRNVHYRSQHYFITHFGVVIPKILHLSESEQISAAFGIDIPHLNRTTIDQTADHDWVKRVYEQDYNILGEIK